MVKITSTNGWDYALHPCRKCGINWESTKHKLINARLVSDGGINSLVMIYHYECCRCSNVIKSSWCVNPGDSVYFSEDTWDKYDDVEWDDKQEEETKS